VDAEGAPGTIGVTCAGVEVIARSTIRRGVEGVHVVVVAATLGAAEVAAPALDLDSAARLC
jgi:hypothetical protein